MHLSSEIIISELSKKNYIPSKTRELFRRLDIDEDEYKAFRKLLKKLEQQGTIKKVKGGKWRMPDTRGLICGQIIVKRKGFGFLIADDKEQEDIFIPEGELGGAFNHDRVGVKVVEQRRRGGDSRSYGKVITIIERTIKRMVCTVEQGYKKIYCLAEGSNIPYEFEIDDSDLSSEVKEGEKVLIKIIEWPKDRKRGRGVILERLGPAGEPSVETAAILANYEVETEFSEDVKKEVSLIPQDISDAIKSERLDFTNELCFTIDPDDAKDFDDAISIKKIDDGYEIGVHIADVSHYIREGTALHEEAQSRSTSIYLPGRVIPMIPHELSSDICSLRPNEDRLAMSVFMSFDKQMEITEWRACRSVINSKKRFTYRNVFDILSTKKQPEDLSDELYDALNMLYKTTMRIRKKRFKAGSIELTLPEFKVVIDDEGKAVGMVKIENNFSHQMVEECMLAANVVMGRYANEQSLPALFRVHEPPKNESLTEMVEFLNSYNYDFRLPFNRKRLNKILLEIQGKPEEHAINLAILMSMNQAVYAPDAGEHFALAFPVYSHFTSPIRRFPDLHLHTCLKTKINDGDCWLQQTKGSKKFKAGYGSLITLGEHCSARERRAMKIEEEVKDLRRLELLADCKKKIHTAIVTGIRDFGVFVEIKDFFVEGLLHRTDLERNDRAAIEVMPGSKHKKKSHRHGSIPHGKGFHLGEEVLITIAEISMSDRKCQMEYAGEVKD